ncbi:hypothetical protein [Deinococcus aquatilis]|uniref:hypothetical protein n=1 Tax=Deinococcus aquatilis TaxID=519440 RepID=UPI0003698CB6|nr:hypothetical protein [Deinococcus aquatilis]
MNRLTTTLLITTLSMAAAAATPPQPLLTIRQVLTSMVDGKTVERLVDVKNAAPGSVLQSSSVLTIPETARDGARYTVPVPLNTTFIAGSAKASRSGVAITYALKATGPFSAQPLKTVTVTENGQSVTKTVPAPANEYRAVRYDFGTLKGAITISQRIRVN